MNKDKIKELEDRIKDLEKENNELKNKNIELENKIKKLEEKNKKLQKENFIKSISLGNEYAIYDLKEYIGKDNMLKIIKNYIKINYKCFDLYKYIDCNKITNDINFEQLLNKNLDIFNQDLDFITYCYHLVEQDFNYVYDDALTYFKNNVSHILYVNNFDLNNQLDKYIKKNKNFKQYFLKRFKNNFITEINNYIISKFNNINLNSFKNYINYNNFKIN